MEIFLIVVILRTNHVVELAHLLTSLHIRRVRRIGERLLIETGQREEELVVVAQIFMCKERPVVDTTVVCNYIFKVGGEVEADLVFCERFVIHDSAKRRLQILTFLSRVEVNLL